MIGCGGSEENITGYGFNGEVIGCGGSEENITGYGFNIEVIGCGGSEEIELVLDSTVR